MSANTKIIVLKSKELIYTGIFILLGILFVLLIIYMFSPSKHKKENETDTSSLETEETTLPSGTYSSNICLGGSTLTCLVTVNDNRVTHVDIENMDETLSVMYPLVGPSLTQINQQLDSGVDFSNITYSADNQYTTIIITEAVKEALGQE